MKDKDDRDKVWGRLYNAAFRDAPPSIGWQILSDHLGIMLKDHIGDWPEELMTKDPDLEQIAEVLAEEVLRLADDYSLAPFDGTLSEHLEGGDTERDWLIREDLMPFVRNWHRNALILVTSEGRVND